MKKVITFAMVAFMTLAMSQKAQAIEDPNPKGTVAIGAHVGFLPGIGGSAFADFVIVDSWWKGHFTIGGELLFRHWGGGYYNYNEFAIAPRACYGLNITKQFEVHAGLITGFGLSSWNDTSDHTKGINPGVCWGGVAGLRFFFTENFGVSAEFQYTGYGPYTNVGVAFKF